MVISPTLILVELTVSLCSHFNNVISLFFGKTAGFFIRYQIDKNLLQDDVEIYSTKPLFWSEVGTQTLLPF